MKKVFIILLLCLIATPAFAGRRCSTSGVTIEDRRNEVGAGVDVVIYEGEDGEILNKVTGEYKYDWQNGEQQAYAVATVKIKDLADNIKKLFKKKEASLEE